jgi:hypothetical protein
MNIRPRNGVEWVQSMEWRKRCCGATIDIAEVKGIGKRLKTSATVRHTDAKRYENRHFRFERLPFSFEREECSETGKKRSENKHLQRIACFSAENAQTPSSKAFRAVGTVPALCPFAPSLPTPRRVPRCVARWTARVPERETGCLGHPWRKAVERSGRASDARNVPVQGIWPLVQTGNCEVCKTLQRHNVRRASACKLIMHNECQRASSGIQPGTLGDDSDMRPTRKPPRTRCG